MTGAQVDPASDVLPIVDTSAGATASGNRQISVSELMKLAPVQSSDLNERLSKSMTGSALLGRAPSDTGDVSRISVTGGIVLEQIASGTQRIRLADAPEATIKGRQPGSSGPPIDLSPAVVRTILGIDELAADIDSVAGTAELAGTPTAQAAAADLAVGDGSTYLGGRELDGTVAPGRLPVACWEDSTYVWMQPRGRAAVRVAAGASPSIDGDYLVYRAGGQVVAEHLAGLSSHSTSCTTLLHVIVYGQSVAVGALNAAVVSPDPVSPGRLLAFGGAPRIHQHRHEGSYQTLAVDDYRLRHILDLSEVIDDGAGETMAAGIGAALLASLPATTAVLVSCTGIESSQYAALKKGTVPYANTLRAVQRARIVAAMHGLSYQLAPVVWVQGEGNYAETGAAYAAHLSELQNDLTADLNAITGAASQVQILLAQGSNWTKSSSTNAVPLAQLTATLSDADLHCSGPLYQSATVDGTHLTAQGSRDEGGRIGRALHALISAGDWDPLYCLSAVRTGATVVMTWHVPSGAIAINNPAISGLTTQGLRWLDAGNGNAVSISAVAVTGAAQITLTLSATPTGTAQQIGIGDYAAAGANGGPATGPRTGIMDGAGNAACHQIINL